ncbi:Hypothetical protein D9617_20g028740 [Elsinoe fawcettii]|nr:Hypothetical protein D9617_20g028740 [Elsinoe fawcettii]
MSKKGVTIVPDVTGGGDVGWTVVNTGHPASEMYQWLKGKRCDYVDVKWIMHSPTTTADEDKAGGQGAIVTIRQIRVGDWVLVRYSEGKMKGQEFAKICAVRTVRTGHKETCRVLVSWGYSVEHARPENRNIIASAIMEQGGMNDDYMVPSDHFDIVDADMIEDAVIEQADAREVIATIEYGLHQGVQVMLDILDKGIWFAVTDKAEDQYQLMTGNVLQQRASMPSAHL